MATLYTSWYKCALYSSVSMAETHTCWSKCVLFILVSVATIFHIGIYEYFVVIIFL